MAALDDVIKVLAVAGGPVAIVEAIRAWRQTRREDRRGDVDILDMLRRMTAEEISKMSARVDTAERTANAALAASEQAERRVGILRNVVHMWAAWGRELHDDWPTVRLHDRAPDLPVYDDSGI